MEKQIDSSPSTTKRRGNSSSPLGFWSRLNHNRFSLPETFLILLCFTGYRSTCVRSQAHHVAPADYKYQLDATEQSLLYSFNSDLQWSTSCSNYPRILTLRLHSRFKNWRGAGRQPLADN